jgi:hypothetical protein
MAPVLSGDDHRESGAQGSYSKASSWSMDFLSGSGNSRRESESLGLPLTKCSVGNRPGNPWSAVAVDGAVTVSYHVRELE